MDISIGTHHLGLGGSETYALTVAEQLARLGHGVTVCAAVLGGGEALARARGIDAVSLDAYAADRCDAIVAQDAGMAYELRRRHPDAPLVFVAHSEEFDEQLPPRLEGLVATVVVLNDRVERRVRALAADLPVVRLRQPIDISRFRPRGRPAPTARRLLALGNNLERARLETVADVAARAGIELVRVGVKGEATVRPEDAIAGADLVIGYGRCVLEAMACGRPAYVYDHLGGDGWVTAETYPQLERDGFGGRALPGAVDPDRLLADLRRYDPAMGIVNRDLAVAHHRAEHHAHELVALLAGAGAPVGVGAEGLGELARLVRAQWAATSRASELEARVAALEDALAAARA
ncbi:MAG: hypothetical protein WD399_02785, partial [Thermoleophilaceae bacterium]